jgi:transposase
MTKKIDDEQTNANTDKEEMAAWIGLDWADKEHEIAEYSVATKETSRYKVKHSPESLHQWVQGLRQQYNGASVGVVIEQARGPVIYALAGYDFIRLYPINPQSAANYRKTFAVSGAKSDRRDAAMLADMAVKHQDELKAWRPDDEVVRSLRLLVEGRRKQVDQVTRLTNQLTAQLKSYYPLALELAGELNSRQACDFIAQWPTLNDLKMAKPGRLRNFYKKNGRPREEAIEQRIKQVKEAVPLTDDPAVLLYGSMMARSIASQIRVLIEAIAEFDHKIAELFKSHPDCSIFKSFPGAGPSLAPRLLAAFGADRDRWESAADVQKLSGVAPVMYQSGKSKGVKFRHACPKFMRQTFQEYAEHSLVWSDWAKAYHDDLRLRNHDHHAAVRALAFKWIRIMYKCWKDSTPYDEATYINAMQRRGSWVPGGIPAVRSKREERAKKRIKTVPPISVSTEGAAPTISTSAL